MVFRGNIFRFSTNGKYPNPILNFLMLEKQFCFKRTFPVARARCAFSPRGPGVKKLVEVIGCGNGEMAVDDCDQDGCDDFHGMLMIMTTS